MAAQATALHWQQKRLIGWGGDCAISSFRQTEDAAANFHKTGILYGKGAYPEGHDHHRRGFVERTIVIAVDERRYGSKRDQASYEWLFGRSCKCCGRVLELNAHNFYRNSDALCGFRRECKPCHNQQRQARYWETKRDQFVTKFA